MRYSLDPQLRSLSQSCGEHSAPIPTWQSVGWCWVGSEGRSSAEALRCVPVASSQDATQQCSAPVAVALSVLSSAFERPFSHEKSPQELHVCALEGQVNACDKWVTGYHQGLRAVYSVNVHVLRIVYVREVGTLGV